MAVSRCDTVESNRFTAAPRRCRLGSEVKFDCFPSVAALGLQTKARRRLISAVHHAVLAAAVTRHTVDHSVIVPLHLLQHFCVAGIVSVGHEIAGAFPTADVPCWNSPGGAGQVTLTSEEFEINRSAEKRVALHPLFDLLELLHRHGT